MGREGWGDMGGRVEDFGIFFWVQIVQEKRREEELENMALIG